MRNPAVIASRLLEDEEEKDFAMQHGNVLPPILRHEDCRLLTDRWGEAVGPSSAETNRINKLARPFMYCFSTGYEDCFLAVRNNKLGILFEVEVAHPDSEDRPEDVEELWGGNVPDDIGRTLQLRASALQHRHPSVEWWVTVGPHIFNNRYAIRAFGERPENPKGVMRDMNDANLGADTYSKPSSEIGPV